MSGVVAARLWFARDDSPRSELTCDKFQRWVGEAVRAPPLRIAETGRIWASGWPVWPVCRAGIVCLAAVQGQGKAIVRG